MSSRTKGQKRTSYHHGNLRAVLMQVTLELASERGVNNISLREVAKRAGVSSSAPFRHFATKNELIAAICEETNEQLVATIQKGMQAVSAEDVLARLDAIARLYLTWVFDNQARFLLLEMHALDKQVEPHGPSDDLIRDTLISLLEKAREQGILRNEVDIYLSVVSARALARGLAHLAIDSETAGNAQILSRAGAISALVQFNLLWCKPLGG